MHKGVISEEIPTAGIKEKFDALLAAVKLMAKQKAVHSGGRAATMGRGPARRRHGYRWAPMARRRVWAPGGRSRGRAATGGAVLPEVLQ